MLTLFEVYLMRTIDKDSPIKRFRPLCARRERPPGRQATNDFDEIASSHCLTQGRDYAD